MEAPELVSATTDDGFTALHLAAFFSGDAHCAALLLDDPWRLYGEKPLEPALKALWKEHRRPRRAALGRYRACTAHVNRRPLSR